ncbi:MAG: DMT family transporter [Alphaproteobacteria bacterium]|nr:MAG: DMT family transporter [Alphaproteobacteria bacterium]
MTARQWLMLCLLSVMWGASFFAVGLAVDVLPPLTIVGMRAGLAALALLVFLRMRGLSLPGVGTGRAGTIWLVLMLMGLLNNIIPMSLITWGQTQISSSLASILNATTPLFTVFVAHFFIAEERLTLRRLSGVVLGFLGVIVIIGPESVQNGLSGGLMGKLAILGAALSYAMAAVVGRRVVGLGLKPLQTAFGQLTMAAFILVPAALVHDQPWTLPVPPVSVWLALVSLAVVSTALAYLLYFRLIAEAGATNASLVTLMIPVVATSLGIAFLGERLGVAHVAGIALIGLGLMVIDGRVIARLVRPRAA